MSMSDGVLLLLGIVFVYVLNRVFKSRYRKKRAKRPRKGQQEASTFLESKGYRIISVQEKKTLFVWKDGVTHSTCLVVDFILEKDGKTYLGLMKSGAQSPVMTEKRSQLLDYAYVYQTPRMIVVDKDKRKLEEVRFSLSPAKDNGFRAAFFVVATVGVLCGLIIANYLLEAH